MWLSVGGNDPRKMKLLLAGYSMLVAMQMFGREIIVALWGASRLAELDTEDSGIPPRSFYPFCAFYESHHTGVLSNALHTCGCVSAIACLVLAFYQIYKGPKLSGLSGFAYLVLLCPVPYYLFNWSGHFLLQKDIPAVFTWAFDGQLFVWGEMCQFRQVAKRWGLELGRPVGSEL